MKKATQMDSLTYCFSKWSRGGSNPWPRHCERRALPAELLPHNDLIPRRVKLFSSSPAHVYSNAGCGLCSSCRNSA